MLTITPTELETRKQQQGTIDLIDVRTPVEYQEVHAESARLTPLTGLNPRSIMAARTGTDTSANPLYVICRSGSRSQQAIAQFQAAGFHNVVNVEGGTMAWERAGLPVIRGERRMMSLERQVRIAAGSMVVVGTALGAFVHPGFLGLAGFIGAGLVFAGVTDTCGMGLALARMPWNRAPQVVGPTHAALESSSLPNPRI